MNRYFLPLMDFIVRLLVATPRSFDFAQEKPAGNLGFVSGRKDEVLSLRQAV